MDMKPRALIFDLGSTLIEYEAVPWDELSGYCVEAGWEYLSTSGLTVPSRDDFNAAFDRLKTEYRTEAADTLVEWTVPQLVTRLFESLGVSADRKYVDGFFEAYYERVNRELFVYEDTVETLHRLKQDFPVMGLISNTIFPEEVHRRELETFGIAPYLDFTVFSSTFRLRKPHPDIFIHAANCAGFAPSECLFVGDRYMEDVEGPSQVGMPAILKVKPGRVYPDMPQTVRRIDCLSELPALLEQ